MSSDLRYSVWTRDDSESWAHRNAGCTDRMLVVGLDHQMATILCATLADRYGDENLEIHPDAEPPKAGSVGGG